MKIQASKSLIDRLSPSTEDTDNQEEVNPSDFFAEMMMGLMLQPTASADPQQMLATDETTSTLNNDELTQVQSPVNNKQTNYSSFVELALKASQQSTSIQASVTDSNNNNQQINPVSQGIQEAIPARLSAWLTEQTKMNEPTIEQTMPENAADDFNQLIDKPIKKMAVSELKSSQNTFKSDLIEDDKTDSPSSFELFQANSASKVQAQETPSIYSKDDAVKTNLTESNPYTQALTTLGQMIQEQVTPVGKQILSEKTNEVESNNIKQAALQPAELAEVPVKIEISGALEPIKKEAYTANIKIYPPELGSVIAKLKISKNSAELTLTTENERVKQVVEAHLPALRDHFIKSDLNLTSVEVHVALTNTDVNQEQPKQQTDQQQSRAMKEEGLDNDRSLNEKLIKKRINSLVDTYV